jgi:hypothetical protein
MTDTAPKLPRIVMTPKGPLPLEKETLAKLLERPQPEPRKPGRVM